MDGELGTYIDGKLAPDPDKLGGILRKLRDPARMRLAYADGIAAQLVDDLEVALKHVRVLVVLGVDVLADGRREREVRGPPEWEREDVPACIVSG